MNTPDPKGVKTDLKQTEARLRSVFENAAIGFALVDLQGRPVKCNPALERILGYSEAELCAMTFRQFTHADDLQADLEAYQKLMEGKYNSYQIEKRYVRKDGQIVWTRLTVSLVHPDEGAPEFAFGMVEDITEQRRAQETMKESEEKFSKAFHGNPYPIVISRRSDGVIVEANQAFDEWYGIPAGTARGKTSFEFGLWKSRAERDELIKLLREQGSIHNYQKTVMRPSGEERIMLLNIQPISIRSQECLLTISTDITQQKKAEQALQRSEERLRRGLAAARMGAWEWNISNDRITWTDQMPGLFGLAPGEFGGSFPDFISLVEPEDRERVQHEVEEVIAHPERKYYSELRVRWPDGSSHWLECRGEVRHGAAPKTSFMFGTIVDVTERKRAEAALRSSEDSLRATIEHTPNVAIQWYDENGRVLYWNKASQVVYGYESSETIGKTLDKLIFDAAETEIFHTALKDVGRTGIPAPPTEFKFHRRDGSEGVCFSTLFRIPRAPDRFYFVCMDVDLTERKRAEQSLREAQERELRAREEYTRDLLNGIEQERQHLAAELHDSVGQHLSIIKNRAYLALEQPALAPGVADHLKAVSQFATDAIGDVRNLVRNLRPLQIEQLGLTDALRDLLERVAQSTSLKLESHLENVDDVIKGNAATHVYRIVQEALNNVIKHSGADRARFTLERDIKCVRLHLSDFGVGFDTARIRRNGGLGLTSIGERAQMLGGSMKLQSTPGTGTDLVIELPIPMSAS